MLIHIGWPQAIYLLLFIGGGVTAVLQMDPGQRRKKAMGMQATGAIAALVLLYWGGFFS